MLKRALALTLALVCCLSILAGCGSYGHGAGSGEAEIVAVPFENKPTIDVYMGANNQLDVDGCYVTKLVENTINVDLNVLELDSFQNQYVPMLAQKIVPDLTLHNDGGTIARTYGPQGAYINILDYLDQMPNVKKFLEENPTTTFNVDGKMYGIPTKNEAATATTCWIWRQDILDKHNLTVPTTLDEWYNTLVTLKGLYPNSTPFIMRNVYAWDKWWANWGLTTYTGTGTSVIIQPNGKVEYPFIRPEYKEWVTFMRKLIKEGLLYEAWQSLETGGWYEAFANDRAFVTYDKLDRIPFLNQNVQSVNPSAVFTASPGFACNASGSAGSYETGSSIHIIIGNGDNLSNTLAYVNWLYSDEGIECTNWGKEGETYTVDENGQRNFKPEVLAKFVEYGLTQTVVGSTTAFDAYSAAQDESVRACMEAVLPYATLKMPDRIEFTEDEMVIFDTYKVGVNERAKGYMAKFMLGDKDIEKDWDSYVQELYGLELQKVIDIHVAAYKRAGMID